jgi:hypothetical protein
MHGKDVARQRSHGKVSDGNDIFAVRVMNIARQRLCRPSISLPCGNSRCRAGILCRAS